MKDLTIIKIGGGAKINLTGLVSDLVQCEGHLIVVLGANASRKELAEQLGTFPRVITSISGYDSVYTDETAMDLIMMTYAGQAKNRLVEMFQKQGVNAIGLSGIDGRLIEGQRNRGIKVNENGRKIIKRDLSGKPRRINESLMQSLLDSNQVPVVGIPILDEQGCAINADNDNIVAVIHHSFRAKQIIHFIEAPGILADAKNSASLIESLDLAGLNELEERLQGRMKRKILAIRQLLETTPTQVVVADGRTEHPYQSVLNGAGTKIHA